MLLERSRPTQSYHKKQHELKEEKSAKNRMLYRFLGFFKRRGRHPERIASIIFSPLFLIFYHRYFRRSLKRRVIWIYEKEIAELEIRIKKINQMETGQSG